MAALEQSEIDKLQEAMESIGAKKDLAKSAKEKISIMYYDVTDTPCLSEMSTLDEIGEVVEIIDSKIKPSTKYYESFEKLKYSYKKRVAIKKN